MTTRWAKRLLDLKTIILNANKNYFDPELFRLNIKNAILTSRTVTFLMQKEKNSQPGLDKWYIENVQTPLKSDNLMGWLVDSRNIIEKEGDLDVHSSWRARHLYSYFGDGYVIENSSSEELFSSIPSLVELICTKIPPGIVQDSALILERKWVANSLPNFELIDAVCYGYEKLREFVIAMDVRVGAESPTGLLRDDSLLAISQSHRMILKLSDGETYSTVSTSNEVHATSEAQKRFTELRREIDGDMFSSASSKKPLSEEVKAISKYASSLFRDSGHHISIVLLLENGEAKNIMTFEPADHVEKIIFWHELAYSISLTNVDEIRFISEAWIRKAGSFLASTSEWKIIGEILHVFGARKSGDCYMVRREIMRNGDKSTLSDSVSESDVVPNFIIPIMRTWGHDEDWIQDKVEKAHSAPL